MIAEKEPRKTRRGGGTVTPPRPDFPDSPRPTARTSARTPQSFPTVAPLGAVEKVRLREPSGPMAHRGPKTLRRAQQFAWRSREAAAVVAASFFVSLLCLYVAAYARVTAEGFEVSELRREIKASEKEAEALRAEISRMMLPETVRERAVQAGMVVGTPGSINMVKPRPAPATMSTP